MPMHTSNDAPYRHLDGILVAMIPVSDLEVSAAWYQELLGLDYLREFRNDSGQVTGCALGSPDVRFGLSMRLRSNTQGKPDLRGEHPVIFAVPDLESLDLIRAHAERLGHEPTSGEHADGHWVSVLDPDGIDTRFVYPTRGWTGFAGAHFHDDGSVSFYDTPSLGLVRG